MTPKIHPYWDVWGKKASWQHKNFSCGVWEVFQNSSVSVTVFFFFGTIWSLCISNGNPAGVSVRCLLATTEIIPVYTINSIFCSWLFFFFYFLLRKELLPSKETNSIIFLLLSVMFFPLIHCSLMTTLVLLKCSTMTDECAQRSDK